MQGVSESFQYDSLDRLKKNSVSGSLSGVSYSYATDYRYDLTGNILYKSDVGSYTYGTANRANGKAGPAALRSAGSSHSNYQYDDNGNLLSGGGRVFQWTSYNKPKHLQKGATWTSFAYGPDRARYLKKNSDGETTVYIGKLYEQIKQGTKTTHKHFIYAGGELAAIQIKTVDGNAVKPDQTRYMHTDNLGSVDTITDGFGNVVDRMGFDPFGMRRMGNWKKDLPLDLPVLTNRGFTGHEHVDELGIIHMNGRIYDPELGRFLSADPQIQAPLNSQSHNRYSYTMNNPLKYTDPSGFFLKKLFKKAKRFVKKWGRTILSIAAMAVIGPAAFWHFAQYTAMSIAAATIASAAVASFVGGAISTGSLKGGLKGAFFVAISAGVAGAIGGADLSGFRDFSEVARDVFHGMSQGLISEAAGGEFKSGFIGGFLGHMAGRYSKQHITGDGAIQIAKRTIVASVVGGTAARVGGGKFANGAVSAAFAHLFNNEVTRAKNKLDTNPVPTGKVARGGYADAPSQGCGSFGCRTGGKHGGVDLLQSVGTDIYAAGDRRAIVGYQKDGYGDFIEIYHGDGVVTQYSHLDSITISNGDRVTSGMTIGTLGATGNAQGLHPHLHFEVRVGNNKIDPESVFTWSHE